MAYKPTLWENKPSTASPVNASNLNNMENGISQNDSSIDNLYRTKAEDSKVEMTVHDVTYQPDPTKPGYGTFVFKWWNGQSLEVDLNTEKIPAKFWFTPDGYLHLLSDDSKINEETFEISETQSSITFTSKGFDADSTVEEITSSLDVYKNGVKLVPDKTEPAKNGDYYITKGTYASWLEELEITINFRTDLVEGDVVVINVFNLALESLIDVSSILTEYQFNGSDQIQVSDTWDATLRKHTVNFSIKDNSITDDKIEPNYLANLQQAYNDTLAEAENAADSATAAAASEDAAREYAEELEGKVTTLYKKRESSYTTTAQIEQYIPITLTGYDSVSWILMVNINGLSLAEGRDYTIIDSASIRLTTPITHPGAIVNFIGMKSYNVDRADMDLLKGEKGNGIKSISKIASDPITAIDTYRMVFDDDTYFDYTIQNGTGSGNVEGVKGNAESTYRAGQVNISLSDIVGSDAIPVANGGTGQTTLNAASNSFINSLDTKTTDATDSTNMITGETENSVSVWKKFSFSKLWDYISTKVLNLLGISSVDDEQFITRNKNIVVSEYNHIYKQYNVNKYPFVYSTENISNFQQGFQANMDFYGFFHAVHDWENEQGFMYDATTEEIELSTSRNSIYILIVNSCNYSSGVVKGMGAYLIRCSYSNPSSGAYIAPTAVTLGATQSAPAKIAYAAATDSKGPTVTITGAANIYTSWILGHVNLLEF